MFSVAQILQRTSLDKDMAVTRSVTDAVNKIRAQVQAQTAETSIDAASIAVGVSLGLGEESEKSILPRESEEGADDSFRVRKSCMWASSCPALMYRVMHRCNCHTRTHERE